MSIIGGTVPPAVAVPPTSYEDNTPLKLLSHTCRKTYKSLSNTDRNKHSRIHTYMTQHINEINTTSPGNTFSTHAHMQMQMHKHNTHACIQSNKQTNIHTYIHTHRQTISKIHKHTKKHTWTHIQSHTKCDSIRLL
jgi:hypothetical protein